MQNLLHDLKELLSKDERFVSAGELLKNKIIEVALKDDSKLLELLLSHQKLREHFFIEIKNKLIFKKDVFLKFVSNKDFLPDSYTSFKNKIGLQYNDQYLIESKDVVLAFPYKDCILQGGQTKEDVKRNEIFWNETLAPDEVDRLLEPKVLANFKKIDSTGEHKITDIGVKDNIIVKGNNLLALHSLKEKFTGLVKLIYIDPPYGRDADVFYNDSFKQSTWLTFMKNRLEVARDLLCSDGAIFVQISDANVSRIMLLLDEIFDRSNFINKITVKARSPSGFKTVNLGVFESAEYILVYSKNKAEWKYNIQYVKDEYDSQYRYILLNKNGNPKDWKYTQLNDFVAQKLRYKNYQEASKKENKTILFDKIAEEALRNSEVVFRLETIGDDAGIETVKTREKSKKSPNKIFVVPREGKNDRYVLNGQEIAFYSKKIQEIDGEKTPTTLLTNIWTDISWEGIASEGGVRLRRGKKPEKLIRRIIEMSTNKGDIVLDFFLGSGTTCAVAHKLGRQYFGIEQLDYNENDAVIRLKNVIKGDPTGISRFVNWKGGGSFIYCELMEWNQKYVDQLQKSKTKEEIKKIWDLMKAKAFLSYRLDIKEFDKNASDFANLNLDDQKKFLFKVLDKNQLYVNLSEIEDKDFAVSKEDKELNRKFYGEV